MTDILGPGSNVVNATISRPPDVRVMTSADTWFQDCSSALASDGTPLTSNFLNGFLANLRAAVRGNGNLIAGGLVIPEDDSDGMLLNSILQLIQRGAPHRLIDIGTVNALSGVMTPMPPELLDGMAVQILPAHTNSGPATLTLLGTNPILTAQGNPLIGNEMVANQ